MDTEKAPGKDCDSAKMMRNWRRPPATLDANILRPIGAETVTSVVV